MSDGLRIAGLLSDLRNKVKQCPCCLESRDFSFDNEFLHLPSMSGEKALPVITGTCTNCGYVLLFDVRILEASDEEQDDHI